MERVRTYVLFGLLLFYFFALTGGALMMIGAIPNGLVGWLLLLLIVVVLTLVLGALTLWIADGTGGLVARILLAGGETSAEPSFSYEESLIVRGRLDDAERAFERRCLDNPKDGEARIRRADFYERVKKDTTRAERFYREARHLGLPPSRELYVSLCLADLCRHAGRTEALKRELQAIVDRHGGSASGQSAQAELDDLNGAPRDAESG
jgi:hypothetical protein